MNWLRWLWDWGGDAPAEDVTLRRHISVSGSRASYSVAGSCASYQISGSRASYQIEGS